MDYLNEIGLLRVNRLPWVRQRSDHRCDGSRVIQVDIVSRYGEITDLSLSDVASIRPGRRRR